MSEEQMRFERSVNLPGDMWMLSSVFEQLYRGIGPTAALLSNTIGSGHLTSKGVEYRVRVLLSGTSWKESTSQDRALVTFTQRGDETTINIATPTEELGKPLQCALERLHGVAYHARNLRREYGRWTGDEAIAHYYRRHAQDRRVTLRDIAKETRLSYDYLRKAKRQYDAAGKWGSKKEP